MSIIQAVGLQAQMIGRVRELLLAQAAASPNGAGAGCADFAPWLYRLVPAEDLAARDPADLAGAATSLWALLARRRRGEVSVRVFNPDPERDGWTSPHTVLELVSDDMPFIVDSVTMALSREGCGLHLVIHPVIRVRRDADGRLLNVVDRHDDAPEACAESVLHLEISRESDPERHARLEAVVTTVVAEVRAAVGDWSAMRDRAHELAGELAGLDGGAAPAELEASVAFLRWLAADHFTFLGYREYELLGGADEAELQPISQSGLGILAGPPWGPNTVLRGEAAVQARERRPLVLTKANSRATVHRPAYLDYIGVKRFGPGGAVVGERRFIGLYTSAAYRETAREIPLLSEKVDTVLRRSGLPRDSHDAKALLEILESYPRDSLFQISADELAEIALGILSLGERQRVRLFVRRDPLGRFADCLLFLPRDRAGAASRARITEIMLEAFGAEQIDRTMQVSESVLVRMHLIVRTPRGVPDGIDIPALESRLADAVRDWEDRLAQALGEAWGPDRAERAAERFAGAFPPAYRDERSARSAVRDIGRIEELGGRDEPVIVLYRPGDEGDEGDERGEGDGGGEGDGEGPAMRCKLFSRTAVSLSDVLPIFEHLGARVVDERPYEITPAGGESVWMYDFGLRAEREDVEEIRGRFEEAFLAVWRGDAEDDGFGALVLDAGLDAEQIAVLRAVARYLRQAGISYSDAYMERTLNSHPDVARMLVALFDARLHPERRDDDESEAVAVRVREAIDAVQSLDEDRILRSFVSVIVAILRTNRYRGAPPSGARPCLAFKLDSARIDLLPMPRPQFEIFAYSPHVEGVHLRGGRVARGGLRWSDRPEDFRTEILGLMKAQMVKNALIVPVGSKGGFVVKRPEDGGDGPRQEALRCYRTFLSALLDLTDNIVAGEVVAPERVERHDGPDPYLVVAADKGTATFSDVANEVSAAYGFWLGDAFASGGSHGYDHKQMGITARGAWESVRRHFRELGTDVMAEDFTVLGIGDMSGDVFGNGMLLSPHIKLVAAFNHRHVFLDPEPDPERSFTERRRLFELAGSGWDDYDPALISPGGGVYSREAKTIELSDEVREVLAIDARQLSPNELIRELLRAPVDLLWNGGIGTYVKARTERNADVGDKAGDPLRVDGRELRCQVVGEGGNLGFTQRGRIEYALAGGRIYTDAIDNVAGVNCSDHEVNIKILLGGAIERGELESSDRNRLLAEMTDAVAERVIHASRTQTQAISLAVAQAPAKLDVHARLIGALESTGGLRREIEFLPDAEDIGRRASEQAGLTAPELAVVMAYVKIFLYTRLLESDLPEDPYLASELGHYFPAPLPQRYGEAMAGHRLRREIIATTVANQLVDRAGTTFAFRLAEETGAPVPLLARAYAASREIFDMPTFWREVEALDGRIAAPVQLRMLLEARRLVERSARWLLQANPRSIDVLGCHERYRAGAAAIWEALPEPLGEEERTRLVTRREELSEAGVPRGLARRVAAMPLLSMSLDIVEIAETSGRTPEEVVGTYFPLGEQLRVDWLRDRILELPRADRWQALSRAALRDDMLALHRTITEQVLGSGRLGWDAIERWMDELSEPLERTLGVIDDIRGTRVYDTTTLPVALRELRNLAARGSRAPDEPPAAAS